MRLIARTMSDVDLDTCGLLCPLPVLKARKRLHPLRSGERLSMLADDPAAMIDVPHFCREQGHTLLQSEPQSDGATLYVIEKG